MDLKPLYNPIDMWNSDHTNYILKSMIKLTQNHSQSLDHINGGPQLSKGKIERDFKHHFDINL